jgi:hypothetical protein
MRWTSFPARTVTIPEMLRMLRGTVIPSPGRRPPPALVAVATPPPVSSQPSPPELECLRRCHTVITTNYSCRNSASASSSTPGNHDHGIRARANFGGGDF